MQRIFVDTAVDGPREGNLAEKSEIDPAGNLSESKPKVSVKSVLPKKLVRSV